MHTRIRVCRRAGRCPKSSTGHHRYGFPVCLRKLQPGVGWRRNGWKSLSGRPIENSDLWKRFLTVRSKVSVRTEIHWEKGKKSPVLKAVDRAAKEAGRGVWHGPRKDNIRSAACCFAVSAGGAWPSCPGAWGATLLTAAFQ